MIFACRRTLYALLLTVLTLAAPAQAEDPEALSRDAVWRAIFARPTDVPGVAGQEARIALGRELFRDTRLSGDNTLSCASCHDARLGFADGRKTGVGRGGAPLARNVPALFNLAWATSFFWDGRAASLETQAMGPILAKNELAAESLGAIAARLSRDEAMVARFAAAFPDEPRISDANILAALAAFERTLVSPETRFDRWVQGDDDALRDEEKEGFSIFVGKGGCVACHGGWRFTDDNFHDIGLKTSDPGRGAVTGGVAGASQFKTPSLREAKHTAPYMHDGSLATLRDVVEHYSGKLVRRPSLANNVIRNLELTEMEKAALVAFLESLSSEAPAFSQD